MNIISIDRKKENNMILKKITIENFRCFKNYEVDLTPGITVFIGKNGAGKTSLLNAIRYGLSVFFPMIAQWEMIYLYQVIPI